MPYYALQKNETLPDLIASLGLNESPETIWRLEQNSGLRARRPGQLLREGDKVWLPASAMTNASASGTRQFEITLRDAHGQPLANEPYELYVSNRPPVRSQTDATGMIRQIIALRTKQVAIRVQDKTFALAIGSLGPAHLVEGYQARLRNLGYDPGPIDGLPGPQTVAAIKQFPHDQKLKEDGIMGNHTRAQLVKVYGE